MFYFTGKKKSIYMILLALCFITGGFMPNHANAQNDTNTKTKADDPAFTVPTMNNPIQPQDIQNLKIVETQGRWLVSGRSLAQYGIQESTNKSGYFRMRLPKAKDDKAPVFWQNSNVELLLPGNQGAKGYTVSIQNIRRPLGISYVLLPDGKELQPPMAPVRTIPELIPQALPSVENKKGSVDTIVLWDPDMKGTDAIPVLNAKLPVISPCAFRLSLDGIELRDPDFDTLIAAYRDKGYAVCPLIDNHFDPALTHRILNDPAVQEQVFKKMIGYAVLYSLNGYNLDFENVNYADKDKLTAFVRSIAAACHAYGLTVSMDVTASSNNPNWSMVYDRAALGTCLDHVILMAYDQFNRTSPVAGPVASYPWVEKAVQNLAAQVPAEKILLGMPLYMRMWYETNSGDSLPVDPDTWTVPETSMQMQHPIRLDVHTLSITDSKKVFSRFKRYISWDDTLKLFYMDMPVQKGRVKIWFEDEKSLHYKVELMRKYKLGGAAFWRKGFEPPSFWQSFPAE